MQFEKPVERKLQLKDATNVWSYQNIQYYDAFSHAYHIGFPAGKVPNINKLHILIIQHLSCVFSQ